MSQPLSQRLFASTSLALICIAFPSFAAAGDEVSGDAALRELVQQALESRTELAQVTAQVRAARARVPQAEAWPEPMLQVGVQNDSFNKWNVGTMETSWVSFMASQTIPFPGKLGAKADVAQSDARVTELSADRVRLSTIAEVRRGYLALQVLRERRGLLARLAALNNRLVELARIRVESNQGTQAELLRAQVELSRVIQRTLQLDSEERVQVQALNQLRRQPLDTAITSSELKTFPGLLDEDAALALAREHSPELLAAKEGLTRADASASLARRSYFPDLAVSAGVMVRGRLDPMWALTLGVPLPVFAGARQSRALAEAEAMKEASQRGSEGVEQVLTLRAHQRADSMKALTAIWKTWQDGLLAQASAAAESTLSQYSSGRAPLSAVLEANAVSISEVEASLQVLANAWRLAIAQDELALGEVATRIVTSSSSSPSATAGM